MGVFADDIAKVVAFSTAVTVPRVVDKLEEARTTLDDAFSET